jgi:amino acid transporter
MGRAVSNPDSPTAPHANHEPATALGRSMRRIGTLLITLSGITPAASVFVMGQDVIHQAGSGAVLAFLAAALLGLTTAYVYAELASAFPLTGGEYSIIGRTMGPAWGLMALGLNLFGGALGQAVFALGLAEYLRVALPGLADVPTALAVTAVSTAVTLFNIRLNAWITGAFLMVELVALGVMTGLGFAQPHHGLGEILLHPTMLGEGGALTPTPLAAIGLAAAAAVFVFNGYGGAVFFGEEMYEARTKLPWVVFWSLAIAFVAETAPVVAVMVGVGDPAAMLAADKPLPAFLLAAGGAAIEKAVSLGVALAIVNAMIAVGLINARQLYCSGRDGVWPTPVNRWIADVHPRLHSPWIATLIMGAATAACCFMSLDLLVMLTSTGILVIYAGVSVAVMVGRRTGTTAAGHYRMPLYPLAPVVSLLALAAVVVANLLDPDDGRPSLIANGAVMVLCAAYYFLYLKRRGGWRLRGADGLPLDQLEAEGLGD